MNTLNTWLTRTRQALSALAGYEQFLYLALSDHARGRRHDKAHFDLALEKLREADLDQWLESGPLADLTEFFNNGGEP